MNHKAKATCPKGHTFEWGTCAGQVKKLFGGTKVCGSKGFVEAWGSGGREAVQCIGCKTVYESGTCPECGARVAVSEFKKKGLYAKLG